MEPSLYATFADQALRDAVGIVLQATHATYRQSTSSLRTLPVAVRELEITGADQAHLYHALSPCLAEFHQALQLYVPEFQRFGQILSHAGNAALSHGFDVGTTAGRMVGSLFGDAAGVVAAYIGGYLGGSDVMEQVQAEGERLQRAFNAMLQVYDDAMAALVDGSLATLDCYCKALASALRAGG
jgi:hypothetical protein